MNTPFSTRFGPLCIPERCRWRSDPPLLGFAQYTDYALLHLREQGPFVWLQSLADANVSFLLTDPRNFGLTYDRKQIPGQSSVDPTVLVMVILPQAPGEELRAHHQAPLLFDAARHSFHQIILERAPTRGLPTEPAAGLPVTLHDHCLQLYRRDDDGSLQVGAA
ncbi:MULTISPECIES: flagellar assembly protein FliW [Acidithiobacillus]|uniref:flagellar assembly protein FliW n=1 Tax=Acidithiobacillus TaxID=119977 RepID=UPI001C0792DB|nr:MULTISPECIES: flagellar assembly protein FliW [Acidithiobacillus]MBU2763225.1 flagellar assembly protein FliW [Acidithiobacillus caldus]MBU2770895.1 flagellar assembly protein FliW [Acidithiobacillus caldus]MBU2791561.1 flagellar assembly protein FliW [Acidithiobacillus caldus]MBU2821283.1 flagellar assembly protein FliW [Acidithiobacillus caldus]MCE5420054.1 flagellar assembly protein FliW [Acidithiobacillus sp.]